MSGRRHGARPAVAAAADDAPFAPVGTRSRVVDPAPPGSRAHARQRFRLAHVALLGQGLLIGILGGFALAWSMANLRFGPEGTPILGLAVTPLHGGLLMACGALAILACLGRWTTLAFSVLAAAGWGALTVACAWGAAHHAPGILGFDPRDTLLYAALAVYNVALCWWLAPTLRVESGG